MIFNRIDYNQPSIVEHFINFQCFIVSNRNTVTLYKLISFFGNVYLKYFPQVKFLNQKKKSEQFVFQLLLNIARIVSQKTILSTQGHTYNFLTDLITVFKIFIEV